MLKDVLQESTQDRLAEMMTTAMGAAIGDLLHDPSVEELRANPDAADKVEFDPAPDELECGVPW